MMRVRFGILFRCVEERVYVATFKSFASFEHEALSDRRFLNVVSVNSNALDATISSNREAHLNLVHVSCRCADARIARDIRRSRQSHLRPVLRLEIGYRTSRLTLQCCRAFSPICPLNPSGILVWTILDVERNVSVQRVDENVA